MIGTAGKACLPCRDRKRKCDRTTPSCSLCSRLGRPCCYAEIRTSTLAHPTQQTSLLSRPASGIILPKISIPSSVSLFGDGKFMEASVSNAVTDQLSNGVGDVSAVRNIAVKYFKTMHLWFPILSDISFYEGLSNVFLQPRADYSLLTLSIALISTMPSDEKEMSSLYFLVKNSIGIVEASNINSLEVVQARTLVSLFEVGHGLDPAAFISLAATARAAAAVGLNRTIENRCSGSVDVLSKSEQGLRVWWGIVLLDRNYSLERGDGPSATEGLGSPNFLPRDGNIWDQKVCSLGLDSKSHPCPDMAESDQIARTLTAFSMLLPEETPQPWPRYCGAIGMCYNALMTIHESCPKSSPGANACQPPRPESLQSSLERITFISKKFNEKICQVDFEAISPFPPYGIHKVALLQSHLWRETGGLRYHEAATSLTLMVKHFSKRWKKAEKYLSLLEAEESLRIPMLAT